MTEQNEQEAAVGARAKPRLSWLKKLGGVLLVSIPAVAIALVFLGDPDKISMTATSLIGSQAADKVFGHSAELSESWLVGSWVMTPKGGADGQTRCGDFNAPSIYKLNGGTAKILTFRKDGSFASLFAYSTPSGDEHTQGVTARWTVEEGNIRYRNIQINDPFGGDGEDENVSAIADGANTVVIGEENNKLRYVRCVGDADEIVGEGPEMEPAPPAQGDDDEHGNLASLCSEQEVVDGLAQPFKSAVGQAMLTIEPNAGAMGLDDEFWRAAMIGGRLNKSTFRFMEIENLGVDDDGAGMVTIRCQMNLRVLTPVPNSDGAFSSYIQFNNAQYKIRFQNFGTPEAKSYLLAEIQPVNGVWDVVSGIE